MIYFASDFHLGHPDLNSSRERERLIINWLDEISSDAEQIHLVGDIFDFWFEWKCVVPKYYVRFLGKLAHIVDNGIQVHFYVGNHDLWTFGYLEEELGLIVHRKRELQLIKGKRFFIEHGDQTPFESRIYRMMTKVFRMSAAQWAYGKLLHPDFSSRLAKRFSNRRDRQAETNGPVNSCKRQERYVLWLIDHGYLADYYVFGHRHVVYTGQIRHSQMVLLGQWLTLRSYAQFDGQKIEVKYLEEKF